MIFQNNTSLYNGEAISRGPAAATYLIYHLAFPARQKEEEEEEQEGKERKEGEEEDEEGEGAPLPRLAPGGNTLRAPSVSFLKETGRERLLAGNYRAPSHRGGAASLTLEPRRAKQKAGKIRFSWAD